MSKVQAPKDHKNIRDHFVFDMKHDGRHKATLVADGNLTNVPLSSVYSGVVSLIRTILVLLLAELNGLKSWGTDMCDALLEALTKEKVCIVAGPKLGPLKGHNLIIAKALHGLRTSGSYWNERLDDCLLCMGFEACKMEPDNWLRPYGEDHCERVAVCVDDLLIASKDPKRTIHVLTNEHSYKFKGT